MLLSKNSNSSTHIGFKIFSVAVTVRVAFPSIGSTADRSSGNRWPGVPGAAPRLPGHAGGQLCLNYPFHSQTRACFFSLHSPCFYWLYGEIYPETFKHQAHKWSLIRVTSTSVVGYDSCVILFCAAVGLGPAPESHRPRFLWGRVQDLKYVWILWWFPTQNEF